jgi:hypothetical protein
MTRRALAVRLVLIVAVATSVATSAPRDFTLTATADRAQVTDMLHVRVSANEAGMKHADDLSVRLELHAGAAPVTVTITSDDPQVPPEQIEVGAQATLGDDVDLIAQCVPDRACDAGLTIEVPAGSELGLAVTATLTAFGDSSFFFPDDRSFPDDATVAVALEP